MPDVLLSLNQRWPSTRYGSERATIRSIALQQPPCDYACLKLDVTTGSISRVAAVRFNRGVPDHQALGFSPDMRFEQVRDTVVSFWDGGHSCTSGWRVPDGETDARARAGDMLLVDAHVHTTAAGAHPESGGLVAFQPRSMRPEVEAELRTHVQHVADVAADLARRRRLAKQTAKRHGAGLYEKCSRPGCAAELGVVKKCKRCLSVQHMYCSRACQVADWPQHKLVCRPPP